VRHQGGGRFDEFETAYLDTVDEDLKWYRFSR
jgi:hypothetical protein